MFRRLHRYLTTTVMPWEYAKEDNSPKLKIGWFSIYPPFPNGVAVMTRYVVQELLRRKDVVVYAIPFHKKIDKQFFGGIRYAKLDSSFLDVVVFYSVSRSYQRTTTKSMVWHTIHAPLNASSLELEDFKKIIPADLLCAPTKMALTEFTKHGARQAIYIPEGIPLENYQQGPKKDVVIFVSRNHYYKGIVPFLDAARLVLEHNRTVVFKLHAPTDINSPYQNEVQQQILSLATRYPKQFFYENHWLSEQQLITLYAEAKILVFPSNNEGFGIPLVEAMASGCVCLTSDKAPMNELVVHNKTGYCLPLEQQYHEFLFPAPKLLAKHIERLLKNKKLFQRISQQAVQHVQQYDIKNVVDSFIEQAKKLIEQTETKR